VYRSGGIKECVVQVESILESVYRAGGMNAAACVVQVESMLQRVGHQDDVQQLVRPIVACQATFAYRNKVLEDLWLGAHLPFF
jgi:hypothetical protein